MVAYNLEKWRRGTLVLKEEATANCRTTVSGKDLCDVNVSINRSASFTLTKMGINCEATNRDTLKTGTGIQRHTEANMHTCIQRVLYEQVLQHPTLLQELVAGAGKSVFRYVGSLISPSSGLT